MEFYSRIINKHDTETAWNNNASFVPNQGEIIIYDKDSNYAFERMKIGDGVTTVANLPFVNIADARFDEIMDELEEIKGLAATGGTLQEITATPGDVLSGKTYNDGEGKVQVGTIPSKAAATYGAKTSAQTISAGQYLSGNQTIAAVTQSGLSAANIVAGKTVTVASNGSNLWSVTGTGTSGAIGTFSCSLYAPYGSATVNIGFKPSVLFLYGYNSGLNGYYVVKIVNGTKSILASFRPGTTSNWGDKYTITLTDTGFIATGTDTAHGESTSFTYVAY